MSQNNNAKHSSPDEIEFGDATLIGIAQPERALQKSEAAETKAPPAKVSEAPAKAKADAESAMFQDEATVVGGKMPPVRTAEPPPVRNEAKPAALKQPEARSEARQDMKADTKTEIKPEMKIEMKPETKSDFKVEAKSVAKTEPRFETKPETKPETKTETKSAASEVKVAKVEPRVVAAHDTKSIAAPAPKAEFDMDRTIVEKVNPLKEAFDARTMVDSVQPKRFNADETQISPPPKLERSVPAVVSAAVPALPSASRAVSTEKQKVGETTSFPESPRFGNTPIPDSFKKNSEPRKTLLDDAPAMSSRKSKGSQETPPDTFSPHHERAHAHADSQEVVDVEELDDTASGDVPHERKPSAISNWIQKIRARTQKSASTTEELESEPKNNRMRNAMIAGGAAVLVAIAIMNFSHSGEESGANPTNAAAAHGQSSHAATASSEAPEGSSAARPNQGQAGGNVAAFVQQFDRSFAKTQDQR